MWIWLVNAIFNIISVILSVLLAMETGENDIPDAVIDPTPYCLYFLDRLAANKKVTEARFLLVKLKLPK
jgi:hypothetical protein